MQIAADLGWTVEAREIDVEEMETFDEVMAVGTAVVITPVGSITRGGDGEQKKRYQFGESGTIGPTTRLLYDTVRAIQNGEAEDKYGWNHKLDY
jgi:branched-chain amino acid aminotransferase